MFGIFRLFLPLLAVLLVQTPFMAKSQAAAVDAPDECVVPDFSVTTYIGEVDTKKLGLNCKSRIYALVFFGKIARTMESDAREAGSGEWTKDGAKMAREMADIAAKSSELKAIVDMAASGVKLYAKYLDKDGTKAVVSAASDFTSKAITFADTRWCANGACKPKNEEIMALAAETLKLMGKTVSCSDNKKDKCAEAIYGALKETDLVYKLFSDKKIVNEKLKQWANFSADGLGGVIGFSKALASGNNGALLSSAGVIVEVGLKATAGTYWRDAAQLPSGWQNTLEIIGNATSTWMSCAGASVSLKTPGKPGAIAADKAACVANVTSYLNSRIAETMSYTVALFKASQEQYNSKVIQGALVTLAERFKYNDQNSAFRANGLATGGGSIFSPTKEMNASSFVYKVCSPEKYNVDYTGLAALHASTYDGFSGDVLRMIDLYLAAINAEYQVVETRRQSVAAYSGIKFYKNANATLITPSKPIWDHMFNQYGFFLKAETIGAVDQVALQAVSTSGNILVSTPMEMKRFNDKTGVTSWELDLTKSKPWLALIEGSYNLRVGLLEADSRKPAYSNTVQVQIKSIASNTSVPSIRMLSPDLTLRLGGLLTVRVEAANTSGSIPMLYVQDQAGKAVVGAPFNIKISSVNGVEQWQFQQAITTLNPGAYTLIAKLTGPGNKLYETPPGRLAVERESIASVISGAQASSQLTIHQPASFNLTGTNLNAATPPRVSLEGCNADSLQILGATQARFTCTPRIAGSKRLFWKAVATDSEGELGRFNVADVPTVRNEAPAAIDCPVRGNGWTIVNNSPQTHRPGGGVGGADDSFALDMNLNTPSFDSDAGRPVYAVADGDIYAGNGWSGNSVGQVLINHTESDGRRWSTGYLHMSGKTTAGTVRRGVQIGTISNVGATNNHLHFVVYQGHNGIQSVNRTLACNTVNTVAAERDAMSFVSETVSDNTVVSAAKGFSKTWTLKNSGTTTWNSTYCLKPVSGDSLGTGQVCVQGTVAPNANYVFNVPMTAPTAKPTESTYKQIWALSNAAGQVGPAVWAQIKISAGAPVLQFPTAMASALPVSVAANQPMTFNTTLSSNQGVTKVELVFPGTNGLPEAMTQTGPTAWMRSNRVMQSVSQNRPFAIKVTLSDGRSQEVANGTYSVSVAAGVADANPKTAGFGKPVRITVTGSQLAPTIKLRLAGEQCSSSLSGNTESRVFECSVNNAASPKAMSVTALNGQTLWQSVFTVITGTGGTAGPGNPGKIDLPLSPPPPLNPLVQAPSSIDLTKPWTVRMSAAAYAEEASLVFTNGRRLALQPAGANTWSGQDQFGTADTYDYKVEMRRTRGGAAETFAGGRVTVTQNVPVVQLRSTSTGSAELGKPYTLSATTDRAVQSVQVKWADTATWQGLASSANQWNITRIFNTQGEVGYDLRALIPGSDQPVATTSGKLKVVPPNASGSVNWGKAMFDMGDRPRVVITVSPGISKVTLNVEGQAAIQQVNSNPQSQQSLYVDVPLGTPGKKRWTLTATNTAGQSTPTLAQGEITVNQLNVSFALESWPAEVTQGQTIVAKVRPSRNLISLTLQGIPQWGNLVLPGSSNNWQFSRLVDLPPNTYPWRLLGVDSMGNTFQQAGQLVVKPGNVQTTLRIDAPREAKVGTPITFKIISNQPVGFVRFTLGKWGVIGDISSPDKVNWTVTKAIPEPVTPLVVTAQAVRSSSDLTPIGSAVQFQINVSK